MTLDSRRERFHQCRAAMESLTQEVRRSRAGSRRDRRQRSARILRRGPDAVDHGLSRRAGSKTCSIPRRTARRESTSPNRAIHRRKARCIPGDTALADHILDSLAAENFDLAQSDVTPKAAPRGGIPHAYGFLYHSILGDTPPPSVPIILNVHFPHNVPKNSGALISAAHCIARLRVSTVWDGLR